MPKSADICNELFIHKSDTTQQLSADNSHDNSLKQVLKTFKQRPVMIAKMKFLMLPYQTLMVRSDKFTLKCSK